MRSLVDDVKIDRRYVVCVVHGRRPPNWIFKGIVFGLFHIFGKSIHAIVYIPTKFRENILIGGRYAPKNLKRALWRRNSTSGSSSDKYHISGIFLPMCDPTKFQGNRSTRGLVICDSTFSIPTFKPALPTALRHSAVKTRLQPTRHGNQQ